MSRRPKLICFDWDGTLINAFDNITHAISQTASTLGLPHIHSKHIESKIGQPFDILVKSLYGDTDLERFRAIYEQTYADLPPPKLLPHAFELINQLKHAFLLAIVTNKQRSLLEEELLFHRLDKAFDSIWTAEEFAAKPSPLMLRHAALSHHVALEDTWMVGDTLADFYAAQHAHIGHVVLLNPAHPPNWAENLTCIQSLTELYDLLNITIYQ